MGLLNRAEELLERQFIDMTSDAFEKVFREAYDRVHAAIMAPAPEYYSGLFALVALKKEMDSINFYERMRKVMFESAEYGTSPAAAAVKEFKIMEEANMYQDISKHGLPRREKL